MRQIQLPVDAGEAKERLDALVTRRLRSFSRQEVQSLIRQGCVQWKGRSLTKPSSHIPGPGLLEVCLPFGGDEDRLVLSEAQVLYQDSFVIAVNKPAGYPTRGRLALGNNDVVEAVRRMLPGPGPGDSPYLGMPHRLDRETSGVLVFGLTREATSRLQRSFASGKAHKAYLALVAGMPCPQTAAIEAPIHAPGRELPRVDPLGKRAVTWYRVLSTHGSVSLVLAHPETGRTHQLRVHFAHIGHPILGDKVYAGPPAPRCMLHAVKLVIPHPATGNPLVLRAGAVECGPPLLSGSG